jgi:hypothetical protein
MMKGMSKLLLAYFIFLAVITIAAFVIIFPFQLDEYHGGTIGKMGILGALILIMGDMAIILINIVNSIVFLIRRKFRIISLSILSISVLSLLWPTLVSSVIPYDSIVMHRARSLIKSEEFRNLRLLYPSQLNSVAVSVLPKTQYFMIGDFVINFQKNTYGQLQHGLGFFAEYYSSGDAIHFSSVDSVLSGLPYHLEPSKVLNVYKLMLEMNLSDAYIDTSVHSTVFSFEQSAGAGERAILLNDTLASAFLKLKMESISNSRQSRKLEYFEPLSSGMYYFRTASYDPF